MTWIRTLMVLAVLLIGAAACGPQDAAAGGASADAPVADDADPAAGICAADQPDCVDTPQLNDDEPVAVDQTGIKQFRRDARFYLGRPQTELSEFVRIGRIDDEHMMLTEDYRIGRITVELDTLDGADAPVVTSATVELPDGPETFRLKE
ncbi:MAG TPA: hypothetical protein VM307_03325 [Egibacteraceae bacterium]|nr:hypothetical protein [Egibacteraceae bacterium]